MRFMLSPVVPLAGISPQERASQTWRAAADLVRAPWEVLREATPERRHAAFAGYIAALEAEDLTATTLAELELGKVA